jgi:hypothetical protein
MITRSKVLIPLSMLMFAGLASADVNVFNYTGITIIPPSNSPIAPYSDTCPPYPNCNGNPGPNQGTYVNGFPLLNMFGLNEQTPEGNDAIFNGTSTYGNQTYDNIYFTTSSPISYIGNIFVDGSQDSGTNSNRSFNEFLLWTFTNVDGPYTLLYKGTPKLNTNTGYESLSGYVGAVNPGSNFVVQFLTTSTSGVRVFDVLASAPEPADFLTSVPLFMLAGSAFVARRRRINAQKA